MGSAEKALELLTGLTVMTEEEAQDAGYEDCPINSPAIHERLYPYHSATTENDDDIVVPTKNKTDVNIVNVKLKRSTGKVEDFWVNTGASAVGFTSFLKREGLIQKDSQPNYRHHLQTLPMFNKTVPFGAFYMKRSTIKPIRLMVEISEDADVKHDPKVKKEAVIYAGNLDHKWDYDFRHRERRSGERYIRCNYEYFRPYGWNRYALNVKGEYYDKENTWLGAPGDREESTPGEWIVTYHGTGSMGTTSIVCDKKYKPGSREKFGKGIYTTNVPEVAEKFAIQASDRQKSNPDYMYIIQNRLDPDSIRFGSTKKYSKDSPEDDGTLRYLSKKYNKDVYYYVSENSSDLRMYGILEKTKK